MSDDRESKDREKRNKEIQESYNRELLKLVEKAEQESAAVDRDNSFHMARTGKRDITVHLAVTVRNTVDGHQVIGEKDREINQWCFTLPAKALPARIPTIKRALWELAHAGYQAIMSVGGGRE